MINIGKLIKKERETQGLSFSQLARKAGCTSRAISYWEAGQREITVKMADQVLSALGTTCKLGNKI